VLAGAATTRDKDGEAGKEAHCAELPKTLAGRDKYYCHNIIFVIKEQLTRDIQP
jgi:hypothetical protein